MPWSPQGPYSAGGPFSSGNANNMEAGISGAYTELESITGNDGVTQATTDGPFTLANFINYILKAIRNITGSANWYDTPATTIASLSTGKADLSGATFTGGVSAPSLTSTGGMTASGVNAGIEMGDTSSVNTPHVDGHSSGGAEDYSARIAFQGGTAGTTGSGTVAITAASFLRNGNTVWDAGNDGSGSGLDADTVDGVQAASILQFGTGGQKTGFKTTIGNVLPSTGMSKGDVHYLSPFALP